MDTNFTEDQLMLQGTMRKFFKGELPSSLVRELQEPGSNGHSDALWRKLAGDGWLGLAIPEEYGGGGLSLVELGILYEEAGRALVPTTLYSTIHAALLIEAIGTEQQKKDLLSGIAKGSVISTVAYAEPTVINKPELFQTVARQDGSEWVLNGVKAFVPNAQLASPMLVVARNVESSGLSVFIVPSSALGVEIVPHKTFGKDRQSMVKLNNVKLSNDAVLGGADAVGKAGPGIIETMQKATALQCVEMAGGMQQTIEMTVQYTTERTQFGRPIGSFQAVQHHAANMATLADGARLISYKAVWQIANAEPAEQVVAMAKAWASDAYPNVTLTAMQVWGGMGYALESDLYLYANRAKCTQLTYGTRDWHLDNLADTLLG